MKLLVVAAIISVCSAARLEHLEQANQRSFQGGLTKEQLRQYLPPDHGPSGNQLNQYLPPDHGLSGGISPAQLTQYLPPDHGLSGGFGAQGNQFGHVNSRFGESGLQPGVSSHFGQQSSQSQFGSHGQFGQSQQPNNFQNIPQQAFDEKTGYIY